MKDTKVFYKEQPYTWQTNVDSLFEFCVVTIFRKVRKRLGQLTNNDKVLDIGCGMGEFAPYTSPAKYVGIDISEENIRKAKNKYPQGEFLVMDATKTIYKDNTFHYIVCIETIEHLTIDELRGLLKEMKRIGGKDCKIVFTTPNLQYLWGLIPWSFWPIKKRLTFRKFIEGIRKGYVDENYNLPSHHYRFKPSFLKKLLEEYFAVTYVGSTYWYNNRAIHKKNPNLQMKILQFSARHKFLWLNIGSQLIIECKNNKK